MMLKDIGVAGIAIGVVVLVLLGLTFCAPADAADGGKTVPVREADTVPTACTSNSSVWECRRCDRDGNLSSEKNPLGGGCLCKFCINSTGKTVEKDFDLREIICFDKKT